MGIQPRKITDLSVLKECICQQAIQNLNLMEMNKILGEELEKMASIPAPSPPSPSLAANSEEIKELKDRLATHKEDFREYATKKEKYIKTLENFIEDVLFLVAETTKDPKLLKSIADYKVTVANLKIEMGSGK